MPYLLMFLSLDSASVYFFCVLAAFTGVIFNFITLSNSLEWLKSLKIHKKFLPWEGVGYASLHGLVGQGIFRDDNIAGVILLL